MVSTDDEEIAEIAKKYGVSIPFMRSEETANDYASTADVIKEVLEKYKELGKEFDTFCCIYPTAPFITAEKLQNAMKLLEEIDVDSVMPITPFSFPPMRGMYRRNGKVEYVFPDYAQKRSQDIVNSFDNFTIKVDIFIFKLVRKRERFIRQATLISLAVATVFFNKVVD